LKYDLTFKGDTRTLITGAELADIYKGWVEKYPFISIEDPFGEDDWESWPLLTTALKGKAQVVGDDLTVTNMKCIKQAIDLYSEDGLDRPFFCTLATPWSGNIVKITNTGPVEFPLTASIVPTFPRGR